MYKLYLYQKPNGDIPVKEFLASLPDNVRGKCNRWIALLQEQGHRLHRPFADILKDGIYELRLSVGHLEPRILYFYLGRIIVMTHGFLKKTNSVPEEEIARAIRYKDDFITRNGGK